MNDITLKKIGIIHWGVPSPFMASEKIVIKENSFMLMPFKQYLSVKTPKLKKQEFVSMAFSLVTDDAKEKVERAKQLVSLYTGNEDVERIYTEYSNCLSGLNQYLEHQAANLFIHQATVNSFNKLFDMPGGEINVTEELLAKCFDLIVAELMPVLKYLHPDTYEEYAEFVRQFILDKIVSAKTVRDLKLKSPFDEINETVELLKTALDIITTEPAKAKNEYAFFCNFIGRDMQSDIYKSFERFLPKIYRFMLQTDKKSDEDAVFDIESFPHYIFFLLHYIYSEQIQLKICERCKQYFVPSRKDQVFCKRIKQGETRTCQAIGPTEKRTGTMPSHQQKFENLVKSVRIYLERRDLTKEDVGEEIKHFTKYYRNELEKRNLDSPENVGTFIKVLETKAASIKAKYKYATR